MALVSKYRLYQFAMFGWATVAFAAVVLVLSGNAEPYVSASAIPITGPLEMFGVMAGLAVVGWMVISQLEKGSWNRAGKRANLAPAGWGLVGKPALQGTVDGRPVQARTVKRRTGSSGEGGSSKTTYTVVEAELSAPAADGLVLSPGDGAVLSGRSVNVDLGPETTSVGDIGVVGSDALARDVLTTRVRDALQQPETMETVYAGNAADLLLEAIPDAEGTISGFVTGKMESAIEDRLPGDAGTVRTEQKGVILNATELEAQATAVAAVAESFERAIADETIDADARTRNE